MEYRTLILKREDGIATIVLNRPERLNALNPTLDRELLAALQEVEGDRSVRVLILTGMGRAFCAGGDFKGPSELLELIGGPLHDFAAFYRSVIAPITLKLQGLPIPTIAMVNGLAYGHGFDLALACDLRIGSEEARFCVAWLRRGLIPAAGATWLLPRLIGVGRAAEIIFTAREVPAQEALELGILNKLVPADKLQEETMALAQRLARGPAVALRLAKLNLYRGLSIDLATALDMLGAYQAIAFRTEDFQEATRAFQEKREPVYRGR